MGKQHKVQVKINSGLSSSSESSFLVNLKPKAKTEAIKNFRKTKSAGTDFMKFNQPEEKTPRLSFRRRFLSGLKRITLPRLRFKKPKQVPLFKQVDFNLLREDEIWPGNKPGLSWRYFFYFALTLLILAIPFKLLSYYYLARPDGLRQDVIAQSKIALSRMFSGSQQAASGDLSLSGQDFSQAADSFKQISSELDQIDELVLTFAALSSDPEKKLATQGKKMADIGIKTAELGVSLSQAMQSFSIAQSGEDKSLSTAIDNFINNIKAARGQAQDLSSDLSSIKTDRLPTEYQSAFNELKTRSQDLIIALDEVLDFASQAKELLGVNQDRRYLLVFENNNELRASGGFIGSYALLDIKSGKIKNLTIPAGGSYETAGGMRVVVPAPDPLRLVSSLWYFWDANWWPDWEMSAKNLMWFYEKSDGPTVDGVIAITPTVMEGLLKVFGPVDLQADYGVTVDADNFWATTQAIIEKNGQPELYQSTSNWGKQLPEAVRTNQKIAQPADKKEPKKILGALFDKLLSDLPQKLNSQTMPELLKMVSDDLNQKQILLYFSDSKLQQKAVANSWAGKMKVAPDDYLSVVDTNIGGGKTDRVIKEKIDYQVTINSQGRLEANLTINREHQGRKGEPFTGLRNVDWLRVYVPQGAKLIAASGFSTPDAAAFKPVSEVGDINATILATEMKAKLDSASNTKIYNENNKTVFANWSIVDPGQTATINLRYELPFTLREGINKGFWFWIKSLWSKEKIYRYSLLVQSQPGALNREFAWGLNNQYRPQIIWQYPENLGIIEGRSNNLTPLLSDRYYYLLFKD